MNYRYLGKTGIRLSEIGLGGWLTVGNALSADQARAVLDEAFELGINFLDTANVYSRGRAEAVWGELLAGRPRDEYVLASKAYFPIGPKPNQSGLSRKHLMEQCAVSLGRLRTDHIDLYQCHRYDENTPLEETVRAMDDLIRQGKILYWGFSQWTPQQVAECLELCADGDRYAPRSSQPQYNMLQRDWEAELFGLCHKHGIGQVCFSPLAEGVLTGKYRPGQPAPPGSRASDERQNQFIMPMTRDAALLARVQRLEPIAQQCGLTMAQLALAWCLRRPEVTSLIVGASRPEQLRENATASAVQLDAETLKQIDTALGTAA